MSDFKYNMDIQLRDSVLFGEYDPGIYENEKEELPGYNSVSVEILDRLMGMNFIDPNGSHDGSPSYREYVEFLHRHPDYLGIGSITSSCMYIDGVEKRGPVETMEELDDIKETFPDPDIVRIDTVVDEDGNLVQDPRVVIYYSHLDYI